MAWPEQRCILRSLKPLVRLSQKDFLFPETRTLTAPPEKPICPFPSPVQKGKERFTRQQGSLLVSGLFGTSCRNRKNASTDRPSSTAGTHEFALIIPMKAANLVSPAAG